MRDPQGLRRPRDRTRVSARLAVPQPASLPGRLVLLGHPVAHSLSPAFQNAALRHAGIPLTYAVLDVPPERLGETLGLLRAQRAAGNVTIPHKEAVWRACDELSLVASRAGAVNTFWTRDDGALMGDNTDVAGFEALVDQLGITRDGCVVACLGSGGAAAAVCTAVERWPGATLQLAARTPDRARRLAARFGGHVRVSDGAREAVSGAHLVVNATPAGMRDDVLPLEISALPRDARVMDLVYRRGETRWVREARQAGHHACDGREMLLVQGAAAFERWLHRAPDLGVMRQALEAATS